MKALKFIKNGYGGKIAAAFVVFILAVFFCAVSAVPASAGWIETPEWPVSERGWNA